MSVPEALQYDVQSSDALAYARHRDEVADIDLAVWSTPHLGHPDIQEQILTDCMWRADPTIMLRHTARSEPFVAEVLTSADRIKPFVSETDLVPSGRLSQLTGQNVHLKLENTQTPPSFKVRTAANLMTQLSTKEREKGGSASSSGNFAQGVAYVADRLDMKAAIFMAETTAKEKVAATKALGGDVRLVGQTFDEAKQASLDYAREVGATVLPPFDHEAAIAGNATIGLEVLMRYPDAEYYFVPVGGGGLLAGIAKLVKLTRPDARVFGVQEDTAASMAESFEQRKVAELDTVSGVADALLVKKAGDLTTKACLEYADGIITVTAPEILTAHQDLSAELPSAVEKSGAVAVAGLIKYFGKYPHINREAVAIVSGGSTGVV